MFTSKLGPTDRIFSPSLGIWCCIVNGRIFGDWVSPAIAKAGMKTEQIRAQNRTKKSALKRPMLG